jgi:hypothetical protein
MIPSPGAVSTPSARTTKQIYSARDDGVRALDREHGGARQIGDQQGAARA